MPARVAMTVALLAAAVLGSDAARAAPDATVAPSTLRDPVNDVRAGDVDLTAISVSTRAGLLVVRFTTRRAITDNVSYTASVRTGSGSWALVARRSGGADSFLLYDLSNGTTTDVGGLIEGRSATVAAPISASRVRAYFRSEPIGGRGGAADRAASTGPTIWFCLTDRRPRPRWGPCIWPGETRRG